MAGRLSICITRSTRPWTISKPEVELSEKTTARRRRLEAPTSALESMWTVSETSKRRHGSGLDLLLESVLKRPGRREVRHTCQHSQRGGVKRGGAKRGGAKQSPRGGVAGREG